MADANQARWRIGVDIGGTFTDLVLIEDSGAHHVLKVPSDPAAPVNGVVEAIGRAAEGLAVTVEELLSRCELFIHGSTVATNTLLEHAGAKVGLVCTEGFRDSLEIRRGIRANAWAHRDAYPEVLVPRHLRRPVRGRIDRDGAVVEPLQLADVHDAVERFRAEGVEAVAVCLFNSFVDAGQEQQVADALAEALDDVFVTASCQVAPIMGEYERASTVVLNAYVAPRTVGYVRDLARRLGELGLSSPLLLIQNNGGAVSAESVAHRPATLLLSGPAAGVGALKLYQRLSGSGNLMSMEIGGTSCDAMLMSDGDVAHTDMLDLDEYHLALPSIDLHTIGAGGGTIAGVDSAGMLFVGPRGAGSTPGPACYGKGGVEPTVTDAQLVLGRLEPNAYSGGSLTLDRALAERAVRERLAEPLGIGVEEAAQGVIRLMEQALLHAMQRISVERGFDPRQFVLVACGGAGPLHGAPVARMLGCRKVYVPRLAGTFCALGMLHSDVRHDLVNVCFGAYDEIDRDRVEALFTAMREEGEKRLVAEGFAAGDRRYVYACDLRYKGQQWDVRVPLDGPVLHDAAVRAAFEREHERLFGHIQPGGSLEMTKLRLGAIGAVREVALASAAPATSEAPNVAETRRVWLDAEQGWQEVPVYHGESMAAGHRFEGPALIRELTTTLFVGAGDRAEVDAAGNYVIEVKA